MGNLLAMLTDAISEQNITMNTNEDRQDDYYADVNDILDKCVMIQKGIRCAFPNNYAKQKAYRIYEPVGSKAIIYTAVVPALSVPVFNLYQDTIEGTKKPHPPHFRRLRHPFSLFRERQR